MLYSYDVAMVGLCRTDACFFIIYIFCIDEHYTKWGTVLSKVKWGWAEWDWAECWSILEADKDNGEESQTILSRKTISDKECIWNRIYCTEEILKDVATY